MNQALQDVIEHREHMIYELRVYRVVQGRMADLLTRFEHQTLPIMIRHGSSKPGSGRQSLVARNNSLICLHGSRLHSAKNSGLRLSQTLNGWPSVNRQRRTAL